MNKLAAKHLIEAREKKNLTQALMAEKLAARLRQSYSLRQYQKLEEGLFPKYKKEIAVGLDEILGTNLYGIIYEQDVHKKENPAQQPEKAEVAESSDHLKYVALLESNNRTLERSIQLSLNALLEGQRDLKAMLKTNQQNIDDLLADNGRKLAEVRVQTSKRNAANLGLMMKMGNPDSSSNG